MSTSPSPSTPGAIAVVGMACWYPGARNPRELWENVLARRQQFRAFLEERMPARDYHDTDPDAPDKTYGTLGAFLDGFRFDPAAWRVPRSAFSATDVSHWLALEVAAQALADAGHPRAEGLPRERTGVIVGNSLTGEQARANAMRLRWPFVRRLVAAEAHRHLPAEEATALVEAVGERYRGHFPATNEDTLAGALSNTIAGRICGTFDLGGGGYVVDGACASSLLAVCTAASALEDGRVDVALAGGVDISMDPFELVGFAKARALTPTDMRVYDRRGNGFIPGEGCGFVVLERLEDARARGHRVYAVLQGWGVSSDGKNAITAPKVAGQARAVRAAWARAGQPDFVEGHGTGTAVGDKVELEALASAAGPEGRTIGVTSLKSILGHTKAAAGIGAFLKAVIAANRRVLPPTAGCVDPNLVFDGPAQALYPLRRGEVRGAGASVKAGASAMGFGGINTHAVVVSGDAPDPALAPALSEAALLASAQDSELFVFGADSLSALRESVRVLVSVAARIARSELVDLSAALLDRLPTGAAVRAAVIASTPQELVARLERLLTLDRADGPEVWLDRPVGTPRLGFLCPGQGSQALEGGRTLLARDPALAAHARDLAAVAATAGCAGLLDALYPPLDRVVTDAELDRYVTRLSSTETAQPALCLTTLVWARRLAQLGLTPAVAGGHSLGELSAFALAGALDEATLMRLAVARGQAMAAPAGRPGGMVSLGCDVATANALCAAVDGYVAIANVNFPRQVVVAGESSALEALSSAAAGRGVSARRLPVSNGFHSALVADAAEALRAAPIPAHPAAPAVTLLSTCFDAPVDASLDLPGHVATQVRSTVDFAGLVRRVAARADLLIEVGTGRVLSGLAAANLGDAGPRCLPVEGVAGRAADLQAVLASAWIRGAAITWSALHLGRLVRVFVPASERVFIPNPCEVGRDDASESAAPVCHAPAAAPHVPPPAPTAPAPAGMGAPTPPAVLAWLLDRVAEKTGFDRASLSPEQRLRDELSLDSIKAGELVAATARHLGVADRVDPAQLSGSPLGEIAAALAGIPGARLAAEEPGRANVSPRSEDAGVARHPPAAGTNAQVNTTRPPAPAPVAPAKPPAAAVDAAALLTTLLARVAEKTGYDAATLSGEQRLQDDLGLDSIKAGELVAHAARQAGVADRLDPGQLLRQPLGEIAAALAALAADARVEGAASAVAGAEEPVARATQATGRADSGPIPAAPPAARWVRTFGLTAIPADPPRVGWAGARVRLLAPATLVGALDAALGATGATLDAGGADVVAVLSATTTPARVRELRAVVDALAGARSLLIVQRLDGRFGLGHAGTGTPGAAFARSISLERPALAVGLLDVSAALDEAALAAAIAVSRPVDPGFVGRGVDAEGWWRLDARPLVPSVRARVEAPRAGELVLVTGGARGITAACAEALAHATGARLALVGSTPRARVDAEVLAVLGRLTLAGIEARYYACDLADSAAVSALVAEVRATQGPITAVVHGAGRNTPRRVEQVSADDALAELAPKLLGAEALLAALADAPPRLVVALTSIIGVSAMMGNAWYAFANEALDLTLARFAAEHPGTGVVSLAYGVWAEIGMGAKLGSVPVLAKMGVGALDPDEGVARFLASVLKDPGVRQPVITAHVDGLPTWPAALPSDPTLRFLDGERTGVAGVEARARITLHPDRDTWLRDHDFAGSLLLPTVFGLEAMAQAAWLARGGDPGQVVAFSDVELPAPVVVAPGGTRIELVARVREDAPELVECEVRTESTGFSRAHFSATVRFGAAADVPALELPTLPAPTPALHPKEHLYGGLLFQGPAFHRMGEIVGGEGRSLRFVGAVEAPRAERWLAGDPFFRDALLQAGQVLVAQDDALPVRIAHIGLDAGHAEPGAREVHASILDTRGRRHIGAVTVVDAWGRRSQRLEGYEVQVLAHHAERPTTDAIFRPTGAAAAALRDRLLARLSAAGAPVETLHLWESAIGRKKRDARRADLRKMLSTIVPGAAPRWDKEGRPSLEDGRALSVAHDDGAALVVVGGGALGCDVESVLPREDWSALLGPARAALLPSLREDGPHLAGTRVWAAGEALYKAGGGHAAPTILRREGDVVELRSGEHRVVTAVVRLERGPARVVAVAFGHATVQTATTPAPLTDTVPDTFTLDPELLSVVLRRGTPDRMETRFVVSFDESGSLSGRVPAFTLATWMGRLRELALASLRAPILEALGSGRHGMVTQNAWVRLDGEAAALDKVEARTWVEELRPSTCLLRFAFSRVAPDGTRTPIGEAAQRFGWVEVLGHGQVRAAAFPAFLQRFLASLHQDATPAAPRPLLVPTEPAAASAAFSTSLVDSNVVGNLYYAHYFKWAQRLVDQLVWRHAPEVLTARGALGELVLSSVRVEFMREAMPFDTIEVSLHPATPEHGDIAFDVVYQRPEADGTRTRLALGRVEGAWSRWTAAGREALAAPAWTPVRLGEVVQ